MHQSDLLNILTMTGERGHEHALEPSVRRTDGIPLDPLTKGYDARVLLVEDNAINQKVARRMLVNLGCHVDLAADGREALECVNTVPYDLVFMDVQMPRMDGLEATAEIRRHERGTSRHIPIVAMTANALASDRERCLAAGMDDYVSKPIRRRDLMRVLQALLHEEADTTGELSPP